MKETTRTIAGHAVRLYEGVRYMASRPWAEKGRKTYPITISEIAPRGIAHRPLVISSLTYDQANAFLAAFNNGAFGFEGRVWE